MRRGSTSEVERGSGTKAGDLVGGAPGESTGFCRPGAGSPPEAPLYRLDRAVQVHTVPCQVRQAWSNSPPTSWQAWTTVQLTGQLCVIPFGKATCLLFLDHLSQPASFGIQIQQRSSTSSARPSLAAALRRAGSLNLCNMKPAVSPKPAREHAAVLAAQRSRPCLRIIACQTTSIPTS